MILIWFITVVIASLLLTGALRFYALKQNIIDIPNDRSSHSVPTPRGGGVAIVICFLAGLAGLGFTANLAPELATALLCAGALVAAVGWLDDHGHVNAKWRLMVHFSAATIIVYSAGGLPVLTLFDWDIDFGWLGYIIAVIGLVWILNLYNFMDGIDGIAGGQAVIATTVIGLLLWFSFQQSELAYLHGLMAASACGFLLWNFPPAKIFMGDAGSGFLGLMLGALLLYSGHIDQSLLWTWLIMLGVFIVDATVTLLRRLLSGAKVYEAHCSHAYQHASRQFGQHKRVTLAVIFINLLWLAPLAIMVALHILGGVTGLLIAYFPLFILAYYFDAGRE